MMKKRTRILPIVFSGLLLLVFVTASPRARSKPNPAPPVSGEIHGQIRWKKEMGLIPIGPGKILASNSACSAFFVYAVADTSEKTNKFYLPPASTSPPKEREGYYVCDYQLQVPLDTALVVFAGMGDVGLLPRRNTDPYYLTEPWIGGTNSRPPAGFERSFDKFFSARVPPGSKPIFYRFEIIYSKSIDYSRNPEWPSTLDEKRPSTLLPPLNFAGAWQGKQGESFIELILQQTGNRVTGSLNLNSVRYVVNEGRVAGNTLRFKVARERMVSGVIVSDVILGNAELVMDEGGTSFTGKILNADASGTLIAR